jgi:hypothetical protein
MYSTCAWEASVRQRKLRRVPYIWSGTALGDRAHEDTVPTGHVDKHTIDWLGQIDLPIVGAPSTLWRWTVSK